MTGETPQAAQAVLALRRYLVMAPWTEVGLREAFRPLVRDLAAFVVLSAMATKLGRPPIFPDEFIAEASSADLDRAVRAAWAMANAKKIPAGEPDAGMLLWEMGWGRVHTALRTAKALGARLAGG